ncbi:hypothetical protein HBI56_056500 [Parastagonospora nodorum]|nr:hypothetical protein HBI09_146730 [Parastagonospora nodorum]KAH4118448.1 hypothetical protein HBH47_141450 [Parastagonospora nodorum]KAH4136301.1 hypothetical protein HBH45_141160 [Parastagonospora nodorum]KAH4148055.1 hypothetical protein HBH44_213580 [Parastagonospora nodorum]KAH4182362.1 hypothetical protein HBH42_220570 [Parastagonospora nodorum]
MSEASPTPTSLLQPKLCLIETTTQTIRGAMPISNPATDPIMDADMVAMSTRGFQQQQHGHQQEYRFSDQHNSRYDQRFDDQRRYYPAESFYGQYEERHQDDDDYPRDMLHRSPFNDLVMHLPEVFNPVSYRLEKRSHIAVCSKSNYNSPRKPDALIA